MNTIVWQMFIIWLLFYSYGATGNTRKNSEYAGNIRLHVPYNGAQVFRVHPITDAQSLLIRNLEDRQQINIWKRKSHEGVVDVLANSTMKNSVKILLKNMRIPFKVMIDDVGAAIKKENSFTLSKNTKGLAQAHNLTFEKYHRLNDIYGYLDYLANTYPTICTVQNIGTSIQGRPIKMLKISGTIQPAKHSFVIEGAIHAREWISPASVAYIIRELVENRANNVFAQSMDFYVVPVTNPDGYEYTHTTDRLWRKNRRSAPKGSSCLGVDLNRNFAYKWGGLGASNKACSGTYYGTGAFSEPESQAIRNFVPKIGSSAKAYISFHSYGQYILYPWSYDRVLANDTADLDRVGQKIAQNIKSAGGLTYRVGNSAILLYPASGTSHDWAKGGSNIKYSYTIELRNTTTFVLPASQIVPTGKEAFVAVKTLAEELIATQ